jgi:hypothetical protein
MHQLVDSRIRITSPESKETFFQILENNIIYFSNTDYQD